MALPIRERLIAVTGSARMQWGLVVAFACAAYRELIQFNPQAGVPRAVAGAEAFFFEATGQPPWQVLLLVTWMIWRRRKTFVSDLTRPRLASIETGLLTGAALILAWSTHTSAADLQVFSLQCTLIAIGGIVAGAVGRRAMLLPAMILFFAIPIPPVLLNDVIFALQLWLADACATIAHGIGASAVAFGTDIVMPRGTFRVIEGCTGVRGMLTLALATVLYSEVSGLREGRCVFLLLCVPIVSIVMNIARVLTVMANPYSDLAAVHTTQGMLTVSASVVVIALIDRLASGVAPHATSSGDFDEAVERSDAPASLGNTRSGALWPGIATAVLTLITFTTPRFTPELERYPVRLGALPRELFGIRPEGLETDVEFLGSVATDDRFDRGYEVPRGSIRVFAGQHDRRNRRGSLLSEKPSYPGSGWEKRSAAPIEIGSGLVGEIITFESTTHFRQELFWTSHSTGFWKELVRGFLGWDQSAFRPADAPIRVFRVGQSMRPDGRDGSPALLDYARVLRGARSRASQGDEGS